MYVYTHEYVYKYSKLVHTISQNKIKTSTPCLMD